MAPLVLLFGMPRSGTTWIGKIFDSHPDTLYRHEPDSRGTLNEIPLVAAVERAEAYREAIERFVRNLPDLKQPKVSGSLPVFAKSYYSPLSLAFRRAGIVGIKLLGRVLGEVPLLQFADYSKFPQIRVVWKSIESLGRLGVIARVAEPHAAVQLLRHPCGYVASVLRGEARKSFESVEQSSEDYGVFELLCATPQASAYGLSLRALEEMEGIERLAWRWVIFNEKAMDDTSALPQCIRVRYEDICRDPPGEARRMFEFAQLSWSPQTEDFIAKSTSSERSGYYSVFKDPAKSASKWQTDLSGSQIARIMAIVRATRIGQHYPE